VPVCLSDRGCCRSEGQGNDEARGRRDHHLEGIGANVFPSTPVTAGSPPVEQLVTELEQVPKKGRLPLPVPRIVLVLLVALVIVAMVSFVMVPVVMLMVPWLVVILLGPGILTRLEKRGLCRSRSGPLDDLVEFAPVQPHSPALRAVVDFDPLTLSHHQISTIDGALHDAATSQFPFQFEAVRYEAGQSHSRLATCDRTSAAPAQHSARVERN
jgi:hypothetical protein